MTPAGPDEPRAFLGDRRPDEALVAVISGEPTGYPVIRSASPLPSRARGAPPPTGRAHVASIRGLGVPGPHAADPRETTRTRHG